MDAECELDAVVGSPQLQRLCRYLSERSPQPMIAVDGTSHVVVYLNPAFAQLVGRKRKDLIGRPFCEAVPEGEDNGCLALLDRVFRTGVPELLPEQEHRQLQSRPVYWSYSVWAILDEAERPAGVMIQVTDVTETAIFRRQSVSMNEALMVSATGQHRLTEVGRLYGSQMQAAVQRRDHFLAVLSHELRNPLTALTTGMQLIRMAGDDRSAAENSRQMMERQLKQMVRLVDELLDVSRIATGKLELHRERVELAAILRDAVEASQPLVDLGRHELTISLPSEPVLLDADPTRLTQVFLNLLNNAAKYSEPGGRIAIEVTRAGSEVAVSVRDAGIGIPAIHLPHLFDVFVQVDTSWQRSQGGMGIGLSLVKEFVELHGGTVEARSDGPGQGSEFVVRLPALVGSAAGVLPAIPTEKTHGALRRILVVDDNRDAAESLAMMLGFMGHKAQTAYDGEDGVAAAAEFHPELILMDIGMPKVNGYEAARLIRAEPWGKQPFLVALTGWGADDDRRRTTEAGFDKHLVKPVELDALAKLIAELPVQSV